MSFDTVWPLLGGGVLGLTLVVVVVLGVLVGLTLLGGVSKLWLAGRPGARSLDEMVGDERFARFLTPSDPRGPVDQLGTAELRPVLPRKGG